MRKTKRKVKKILGYCALCSKAIRVESAFDLINKGGKMRAVCKGGCEEDEGE